MFSLRRLWGGRSRDWGPGAKRTAPGRRFKPIVNGRTGEIIVPGNRKITKTLLRKLADNYSNIEIDPSPIRNKILDIVASYEQKFADVDREHASAT